MPELVRRVAQESMTRYSGPGNIHSDLEVARSIGLEATIAQGMQTLAIASELMTTVCGEAWLARGELAVTFTKPVRAGDEVRVEATPDGDGYEIEARNEDGDLVMVGRAAISRI